MWRPVGAGTTPTTPTDPARGAPATERRALAFAAAAVALATFAAYLPALRNGFVVWDDPQYVVDNAHIRVLGAGFLKWAFLEFHADNWHPLTWISHALDWAMWGPDPFGHHLTSVVLHAINAGLVLLLAVRLVEAHGARAADRGAGQPDRVPGPLPLVAGVLTALLFGLHPAHVESVAWVSERKDVLCAAFYLGGLLLYLRYARLARTPPGEAPGPAPRDARRAYALMTGAFVLAILSKPMAVTFPAVLLVLDAVPLRRLSRGRDLVRLLVEKAPLVAVSAASCALTLLAQRSARAGFPLSLAERLVAANAALTGYVGKLAWPEWLIPYYPHPLAADRHLLSARLVVPILLNLAVTVACVASARRARAVAAAWACFVVTLAPVIGIVQVGAQGMADRYTYLPSVPLLLLVGLVAQTLHDRATRTARGARALRAGVLAMAAAAVIASSIRTLAQIPVWRDGVSLWTHQLAVMDEQGIVDAHTSCVALTNRGVALEARGEALAAIADYTAAIGYDPWSAAILVNRGDAHASIGRSREAVDDYERALLLRRSPDVHLKRAAQLAKLGRHADAVRDYDLALEGASAHVAAEIHYNRGNAYARMNRVPEAFADFTQAIERSAGSHPDYFRNRAWALKRLGRDEEAARDVLRAVALEGAAASRSAR